MQSRISSLVEKVFARHGRPVMVTSVALAELEKSEGGTKGPFEKGATWRIEDRSGVLLTLTLLAGEVTDPQIEAAIERSLSPKMI